MDQTPPATTITVSGTKDASGNYDFTGVKISLTATDAESGILKTEYSLDNGVTVKTYTEPFTITTAGSNTLLVKSTDNLGNEEKTQTTTISISSPASSNPGSSSSSDETAAKPGGSSQNSTLDNLSATKVLGVSFQSPIEPKSAVAEALAVNSANKQAAALEKAEDKLDPILTKILVAAAGIIILGSLALGATFVIGSSATITGGNILSRLKGLFK